MKVSIITATFNASDTLASSAESLFHQTYPDIEYIVVDGGSVDGTAQLVSSFGDRVDHFITEGDRGTYDALNKGMALSTGEVIGILHADDILAHPKVIENVVSQLEETSCDALYGDLQYVQKKNPSKIIRNWRSGTWSPGLQLKGWMPPHPTLFIRRVLYLKHGPYDLLYRISSDYDFMLRLLTDPTLKICYLNEVMVKMRLGGKSNATLRQILRKSKEDLLILRSHSFPHPFQTLINKNLSKTSQFFSKRSASH